MSDGRVVGVVGPETAGVETAVEAAGATANPGPATAVVGESDAVVAVGEAALLAVARAEPSVPVLPVDAGRGTRSVAAADVDAAVEALVAGEYDREAHPLVAVTVDDRTTARAFADVMLVSAEPAEISEYTVAAAGRTVARFRADGVAVATPLGSSGYAARAGGPVLSPSVEAVAVVPVAPFSTDLGHWVLGLDGLCLSVERDDPAVDLVADDRVVSAVEPGETVRLSPGGSVPVAVVAASGSPFERR